jgi:hypothetical protein
VSYRLVNAGLTGANCTLGGQALISLSATEDIDADYATATAVCIAEGGAHAAGATVETVEAGVSTGYWVVEDPMTLKSGEKTWRRKNGAGFAHIPWVTYRLRRKGYHEARASLSRANLGSDSFPPKFWSTDYWWRTNNQLVTQMQRGEIDVWEYQRRMAGSRVVATGSDIIRQLCALMGLAVEFAAQCPVIVDEYLPVNKPLITAVKEVASWSGCSVYLTRTGVLKVFDFAESYGRGGGIPTPAAVLEWEHHDSLYPVTHVTVVGEHYDWSTVFMGFDQPFLSQWQWQRQTIPIEWTESVAMATGMKAVEERIELREYSVTPLLAQKVARERLTRAVLGSGTVRTRGPADGCQSIQPLSSRVFSVTRSLEWGGDGYRYDIDIMAPYAGMGWNSPLAPEDTWT